MSASEPSSPRARVDRWSLWVFVVVVVAAVPLLLYIGREQWFFYDEWWILGDGDESIGFLDSFAGHWITVNVIAYRINYWLWGVTTYLPYQVPVVFLHLGSAVLLRVLMRRLGVRGWIATVAAVVFVFYGSGSLNIFFGFQVSLTGSLFCGLAMLLLADRDGSLDRRDWFALGIGVVGLMTSGVFVPLVVGVGAAVLLRRGPWMAAFYTGPLGCIYGVWYLLYGRDSVASGLTSSSPSEVVDFVATLLGDTLSTLAQSDLGGLALGLVALGAAGAGIHAALRLRDKARLALIVAFVVSWIMFASLTGLGRAYLGALVGDTSRYLHISAALVLPLIALGAEYLARRNLAIGAVAMVPLAVGLPGNVDAMTDRSPFLLGNRTQILALASSEYLDDVPPDLEPLMQGPFGATLPITAGWLAQESEAGKIPEPDDATPRFRLQAFGFLALRQHDLDGEERECPRVGRGRARLQLEQGERIIFDGDINVTIVEGRDRSLPLRFRGALGSVIEVSLGPLDVLVADADGGSPRLCEPMPGTNGRFGSP